ncbi:23S rRNA pseudouridine2605 synthase [Rhodoblastus acidophilus]|uniref:pseudouridine synthase n=1 Tax=Rhodoblastus acidophilus TaxID=1074 RepID=UPI002225ACCA|nr:pseudouridine synthase [Rhodoblastus acidophilus]MCW2283629.1 23S rRNA pseudouridine2605 synthase [Rhodoblastus acidophilus]MCW2332489.1 23S rRNA pseudouridine2605 synthase [Rhodoblastus acidophilus]
MTRDKDQKFGKKPPKSRPSRGKVLEAVEKDGERIAKVMARAGLCSRRDAEDWIAAGRVSVNGKVLESAALNVTEEDKVLVDGKPLATRERTRLFLFHKPRGLVTTDRDPEGRATVFDYIAENNPDLPRLMSVGRLDINTEGLLLLTNDGGLARVLELPSTGWLRRYRARANGATDQARLDTLKNGVTIDGIDYAGVEARLDRVQGANVWITLGLREGKNREVKRLLEYLGLAVNRLIRISYGPFQLGELPEGTVEEVKTRVLADQLGEKLAQEAGVDFDGPVIDRTVEPEPDVAPKARPPRAPEKVRPHRAAPEERRPGTEKPGPRKHVSALRDDRVKAAKGPRRRIETGATADRNGRTVAVERVSVARRVEEAPVDTRNARRFKAEREAAEAPRGETSRKGFDRPRSEGGDRPRRDGGGKVFGGARGESGGDKPFRRPRAEADEQKFDRPRREGAVNWEAREGRTPHPSRSRATPSPARGEGGARDRFGGEGAERKSFGKPRGETGGDKPFRRPRAEAGGEGSFERPRREGGDKRFGGPRGETGAAKTFRRGPKPVGGKPGGGPKKPPRKS